MARPGPSNSLSDVAGLSIGCAGDENALTGVTVIVPEARAVCGATCQFDLAVHSSGQLEVCDVGARNQQDDSNRTQQ